MGVIWRPFGTVNSHPVQGLVFGADSADSDCYYKRRTTLWEEENRKRKFLVDQK